MEVVNAYMEMLQRYTDFSGKTNRAGYWYAMLGNLIVNFVLGAIVGLLAKIWGGFSAIFGLYSLLVLIPGLAISVRRLHDAGKSGVYLFMSLIPIVGWILVLLALCKPSAVTA